MVTKLQYQYFLTSFNHRNLGNVDNVQRKVNVVIAVLYAYRNGLHVIFLFSEHVRTIARSTLALCTSQGCLDNEVYGVIAAVSIFPGIV